MADVAKLQRLHTFLVEHPEAHDQSFYNCGTVACAGGWAVALERGFTAGDDLSPLDSEVGDYGFIAGELLGLNLEEQVGLFLSPIGYQGSAPEFIRVMGSEQRAVELIDALIARELGAVNSRQIALLKHFTPKTFGAWWVGR